MLRLIIAEKKSVAELLAKVLKDKFNRKTGYFLGTNSVITWAYGHLLDAKLPEDYKHFGGWNWESIPFFPPNNELEYVRPNKEKFDKVRSQQLSNIEKAYKQYDIKEVINACDAEREGELIFWEIYHFLKMKEPVKRLWLQSQEESDVIEAFRNLKDESFFYPKKMASYARQYADWLYGNNLTVAFTTKTGQTLHIGRVSIPTLNFLVRRRLEIENFKPETYYELNVEFGNKYEGKWFKDKKGNTKFNSLEEINDIVAKIEGSSGEIIEKEVKVKKENPKGLFDLGGLQKEANSKFGFTAKKTLDIAQLLYDKYKVISYPRTSSAFLMDSQIPSFKPILDALSVQEYKTFADDIIARGIPTNKSFVDNKKVTDHYAIIPTKKRVNWSEFQNDKDITSDDIKKLYDLIVRRFLSVFYPAAEYEQTEIITKVGDETFKTSGRILINPGWKQVYGFDEKDSNKNEKELPPIEKGEINPISKINKEEKQTKPPAHYNDRSLIGAMETAKDYLEEEELKEELKNTKTGMELGTPATRDTIIERLVSRGYASRKGKQIIATDLGVKLIQIVPDNLKTPEVTAKWEMRLKEIENNRYDINEFKEKIGEFVTEEIENIKNKEINVMFEANNRRKVIGTCPKCSGDIIDYEKGIACVSSTREYTCFKLWKTIAGKKLSNKTLKRLIESGETEEIKGFKTKTGKKFDAKLKLKTDYSGVTFVPIVLTSCPKCDKPVTKKTTFFSCETHTKENPCLIGPTEFAGKTLSNKDMIDLITKKETEFLTFTGKNKNKYEAKIVWKDDKLELFFKPRKKAFECPECGGEVIDFPKVYKCSNKECNLTIFKEKNKKKLSLDIILEVLNNGSGGPYDGFISKKGNKFTAKLKYDKTKKTIVFDFENN